jgi:hypothetical protein
LPRRRGCGLLRSTGTEEEWRNLIWKQIEIMHWYKRGSTLPLTFPTCLPNMDPDTSWCPVCDRQILPKRFLVPVAPPPPPPPAPPPSSPTRRTKGATLRQRSGGLVQGTGRVKPNGSLKRSDSKQSSSPTVPIKHRTVIDQGPTPLYCSDECQMADIHEHHAGLPMNYSPTRQPISPSAVSFARSDSDSTDSSLESQSSLPPYTSSPGSNMSPSLATLAAMYNFPPLPPPPPIDDTTSSNLDSHPPEYTSGVMMAARRITEYCPKPQKRDPNGNILPPAEPPKPIPGWNDHSNGWRSSIYSFSSPRTQSGHDIKAYKSFNATSHRSRGIQSTFTATSSRSAVDVRSAASLPAEANDMIHRFSQSFNRRSESRVSLFSSSPELQSPISTSPGSQKRERSLLQPGAEGKLLVPNVKMKVHSSSSASLSSKWSPPNPRKTVRSPLSAMSSDSDEDVLAQRCESATSLPQLNKRPTVESESLYIVSLLLPC